MANRMIKDGGEILILSGVGDGSGKTFASDGE
jgi:hypothetical protein